MMKGQAIYNEVLSGNEMGLPQRNNYFKCVELTCSGHDMSTRRISDNCRCEKRVAPSASAFSREAIRRGQQDNSYCTSVLVR